METEITPFDWQRILIGDTPPWFLGEIVLRTLCMYFFALLVIRLIGKRGMQQMNPLELMIIIALGSAVGDPMFYPDVPLLHGFVVVAVVVAAETGIARWKEKHRKVERFFESPPVLVVKKGQIQEKVLIKESLSKDELMMRLREKGIENTRHIERAYLEPSGFMSVFQSDTAYKGESTLPKN